MGTLSDITAQASNNIKRRSNSSMGYQTLQSPASMEKENLGKSRSPHFMTPTFSSSKQSVAANLKDEDRSSTPVPPRPIKAEGNNAWMKSAAKCVGFRRNMDGAPRSRKESPLRQVNTISFPDKVRSSSSRCICILARPIINWNTSSLRPLAASSLTLHHQPKSVFIMSHKKTSHYQVLPSLRLRARAQILNLNRSLTQRINHYVVAHLKATPGLKKTGQCCTQSDLLVLALSKR